MANKSELPIMSFAIQADWEQWLDANHATSAGVWIKFAKKGAAATSIVYKEALDAALCYGWIDSQVKKFDDTAYLHKFCSRGAKSVWSQINREHVARLTKGGRMRPPGLAKVEAAKEDGRWDAAYASPSAVVMPDDFREALEMNGTAKAFYATLNKANTYGILTRIAFARKAETRAKRIKQFVEMLARGVKLH